MKVSVPEFASFQPDYELVGGVYTATINKAQMQKNQQGNPTLLIEYLIQGGPEQPDGNPDPVGRTESEFIPLGGFSKMKDGGKFVLTKLSKLLNAIGVEKDSDGGFDSDEMLQATLNLQIVQGVDKTTGAPRSNIVNYMKVE